MFDNIIGHTSIVSRLKAAVIDGSLPPGVLFTGSEYTGKATVALELARVVTCTGGKKDVPWSCRCSSCGRQRHLLHPDTLMTGGRSFMQEIAAAGAALKRDDRTPLRFLFTRAVRKLARRFDYVLWEGDEKTLSKAEPVLQQLDELLTPLEPERSGGSPGAVDAVIDACRKLVAVRNLDSVPVDLIRRLSSWAHLASASPAKVAIIENVDLLNDSARNALLKTLEEPPAGVHFILTSRRRGAVIETILSRVRQFSFEERSEAEARTVMETIFREPGPKDKTLRHYFLGEHGAQLRGLAEELLSQASLGRPSAASELDAFRTAAKEVGGVAAFRGLVEELLACADRKLRTDSESGETVRRLHGWRNLVAESLEWVESYNIDPMAALETLHTAMRQVATRRSA